MDSTLTESAAGPAAEPSAPTSWGALLYEGNGSVPPGTDEALRSAFLDELDDPTLVLSPQYIGRDRRRRGLRARFSRVTFGGRRSVLRVEVMVIAAVALLVTASVVLVGTSWSSLRSSKAAARTSSGIRAGRPKAPAVAAAAPARSPVPNRTPATSPHKTVPTTPTPAARATPAAAPTPVTAPPPTAPPATAPAPLVAPADLTPAQMGAQALALVRYPWQRIPGYTIQFLPIADAPSPGFYGNTTFTWGRAGGTSVLYVYPGETVDRLAGITAFEIGHEVDAAAVEPQGGETQIENVLGIHPASWAPNCDCAEQGFLSGWYASAFSNYWSPGVGDWSQVAPEPSGGVLAAVEPWLNPTVS
jgi:hypothetical protein